MFHFHKEINAYQALFYTHPAENGTVLPQLLLIDAERLQEELIEHFSHEWDIFGLFDPAYWIGKVDHLHIRLADPMHLLLYLFQYGYTPEPAIVRQALFDCTSPFLFERIADMILLTDEQRLLLDREHKTLFDLCQEDNERNAELFFHPWEHLLQLPQGSLFPRLHAFCVQAPL